MMSGNAFRFAVDKLYPTVLALIQQRCREPYLGDRVNRLLLGIGSNVMTKFVLQDRRFAFQFYQSLGDLV